MSTAMTPAQWRTALENEGVKYAEHSGWTTHNRNGHGAWGDMHMVLIHHTAGTGPGDGSLVYAGRSDLPGPLAHGYLAKTGTVTLASSGRANHAGLMARNAYDSFVNEQASHPKPAASSGTVDGNAVAYGLEISNLGTAKDPYPAVQYDAAVRWATAICRHHGWSANSVGGHKETSVEGKVDPSFDMNAFRAKVAERLAHPADWNPSAPAPALHTDTHTGDDMAFSKADLEVLANTDGVFTAPTDAADYSPDAKSAAHYWSLNSHLVGTTSKVRQLEKKIDALTDLVKQLLAHK